MQPLQILAPDGSIVGEPLPDTSEIRRLYGEMVTARVFDQKCSAMQRQGRLATYAPFEGQEAAQIGAVSPLQDDDWLVATYRDAAAMAQHRYPMANLILGRTGDERGGKPPDEVNVLPPSITVGAHMIHAVGIGWAEQIEGSDRIAMTMFGDGATSEGDFHEAMNFAGVYRVPVVFVCQNNGWAISMPRQRQTASPTIAQKADGYGMPGVLVDGNDVLAVASAAQTAVDAARGGAGPTLIEALTYRIGPHTTTDDPGRYRQAADEAPWRDADPLARVMKYLAGVDAWDEQWETDLKDRAAAAVEEAVAEAESLEPLSADEIFEGMFAQVPSHLERQRGELGWSS